VYFARDGDRIVLLLLGGDKSSQAANIKTAKALWQRYQQE
jgi:putative addiction module killer protein